MDYVMFFNSSILAIRRKRWIGCLDKTEKNTKYAGNLLDGNPVLLYKRKQLADTSE